MSILAVNEKQVGSECLAAAIEYIRLGWSALILCPASHVGVGKIHGKNCESPGKAPFGPWKEYQERLATEEELRGKWKYLCNANVGLAYGPVSGLIGIDIDGPGGEALLTKKGEVPPSLEFSTPGGGRRILLAGISGLRTTSESPQKKQEVRFQCLGAQTVMPPSLHLNGGRYTWVPGRGPGEIQLAQAPAWLLAELSRPADQGGKNQDFDNLFLGVEEGSRNCAAASVIGKILAGIRDLGDSDHLRFVYGMITDWNEKNDPPLPDAELKKTFRSILGMEKRSRQDEASVATAALESIQGATEAPAGLRNGEAEPPEWHLIIVESSPPEYYLRSPHWSDSPTLDKGYLRLTAAQILNWTGNGIKRAAFSQAGKIVVAKIPKWSLPGGALDRLLQTAERRSAPPERKQDLYILGVVVRWLLTAKKIKENKDGTPGKLTSYGTPILSGEGTIIFKLHHLWREAKIQKETFLRDDLCRVLQGAGAEPKKLENTRWWIVAAPILKKMQEKTGEGEETA